MKTEYSGLTLNLKEILSGKEIEKRDIPDIEFLVKESELFGENLVSATKPLLLNLTNQLSCYTGLNSDLVQTLTSDPSNFDELASQVLIDFSNFDVDEARKALRLSVATYVKGLQTVFLNFYPRLKIHSLYVDYLKKENLKLAEQLQSKNKTIENLKKKVVIK